MTKQNNSVMGNVTPFAEIQKLTQAEAVLQLGNTNRAYQRAFVITAKLLRHVEKTLKSTQTVGGLLKKEGIKKSTIDNARYAAKVFDLVEAGKISEANYDTFTFPDCLAIIRVMSSGSKKRLTADEVAALIKLSDDFEPDLHELYVSGLTLAEKVSADILAAKAEEKAKADAKAAEIKAAADLKAIQEENAKLTKQVAENAPPQVIPPEPPEENSDPVTIDQSPTEPNEPAEPTEPVEPPVNIVAMAPTPPRKKTAADLCNTLDAVFSEMADLTSDEQAVVGGKLMELANIIALSGIIQTTTEQSAPVASKRKAA